MIAILILMFVCKIWTPYVFDVGVGLIMILTGFEISNMLTKMGLYNYSIVAGFFPVVAYTIVLTLMLFEVNIIIVFASLLIAVIGVLLLTYIVSLIFKKKMSADLQVRKLQIRYSNFALRKVVYSIIPLIYPTILLMFLVLTNHIGDLSYVLKGVVEFKNADISFIALIVAFLIPIIADTFAMLFGMLFKGPKLCPKISPNKTISGFVCGVIMTTITMIAVYFVAASFKGVEAGFVANNIGVLHFALMGFVGALICTAGDLFESWLKRRALVKDSGNFIPGHGGVLDRFDSHIFNAPFVFFFFFALLI